MDVNEQERLSNITRRHKLKQRNSAFIIVLHITVTVGFSTMRITHILIWVWNGPQSVVECLSAKTNRHYITEVVERCVEHLKLKSEIVIYNSVYKFF
jgi:hypothetical protein